MTEKTGGKDNEIYQTICSDPGDLLLRRDPALFDSVSDTGKRIWTDPYVPASGTRDLKDRRRPGDRSVFDIDHAADVYSSSGRTGSILGTGKDDADPGMCDHGDIHGGCYGDCRESDGSLYSKAGRSGDQTKGRRSRKLVWKI